MIVERRAPQAGQHEAARCRPRRWSRSRVGERTAPDRRRRQRPRQRPRRRRPQGPVQFYPNIDAIRLVDYKVRIIDSAAGTRANVRVLIESTDGEHTWPTVGASTDIIEASWLALADSLEYWLIKRNSPGA